MTSASDPAADALAEALARAGLGGVAPPAPVDPLSAALAAAGLADTVPGAPAPPQLGGGMTVTTREEDDEPEDLPRWPSGIATGVGSMPGTDVREAAAIVAGEIGAMPFLPELPARGVGADMIGRTAGLLVDIAVEVVPSGYRVTQRPGRDHRRAVDLLRGDLDAFDEACDPVRPGWVKVQAAGPWTLAASVETHAGHRVLTDRGAVREFAASLLEGLRTHVAEVAARSGARVVVQLDEPSLPAVLRGTLPTASGYGTVRSVDRIDAADVLREFVDALAGIGSPVVLHCCADEPPMKLLSGVGAAAIGIDGTRRSVTGDTALPAALDAIGEVWDAGTPIMLGLVATTAPPRPPEVTALAKRAFDLADRLGFARHRLAELAVPTPTCGLAGTDPDWARTALGLCRELGAAFLDPTGDKDVDDR
ncbi:methionine synthase [Pseudonocardia sp. N23]|uniref:methionine synthase n=1 Tax=Pseudonocardia sp. N23 TaxID=1987376 RepID=UPI000C03825C|nr:methionine synthase [Pseudonocardia sp. N23]GAY12308.1 methionine synthase, vitamin-B12 independent, putative [Pseudonocardia sp. N23]